MPVVEQWAAKKGLDVATLTQSEELREAVFADFAEKHTEANLNGLEKIKKIHFASEPMSVENGILTPTFKLIRHAAKRTYKDVIHALYEE